MVTYPPQDSNPQDSVSVQIANEVAAHEGIDPVDVSPPLHNVVNTSALDALFDPTIAGHQRTGRVTFAYRGHTVVIENNEGIEIDVREDNKRQNNHDEVLP
ncbi:HalOD1 output domain-containing protein [Halostagnicola sp. A-GB9-2]|uniref:HalOD1 output domain-containing protein n=1 Tax=Halostagnicola sp. A-GB9-2 TaxID=3048066 RepID=UPI0024BF2842|nr:HalOD1 output domain-containing protein [Halostagnicola sp. A-GB9-2]MDJ1432257.1 hypothetical protein [Halostagnicola sp. A-GB9-2]